MFFFTTHDDDGEDDSAIKKREQGFEQLFGEWRKRGVCCRKGMQGIGWNMSQIYPGNIVLPVRKHE